VKNAKNCDFSLKNKNKKSKKSGRARICLYTQTILQKGYPFEPQKQKKIASHFHTELFKTDALRLSDCFSFNFSKAKNQKKNSLIDLD